MRRGWQSVQTLGHPRVVYRTEVHVCVYTYECTSESFVNVKQSCTLEFHMNIRMYMYVCAYYVHMYSRIVHECMYIRVVHMYVHTYV